MDKNNNTTITTTSVDTAYTADDVLQHDKPGDAWMIVDGWVIDVTLFLSIHPGGSSVLMPYLGRDASEVFVDPSVHVHGKAANYLLNKFVVGHLKGSKNASQLKETAVVRRTMKDYGIDPARGLLWQIAALNERYDAFLHDVLVLKGPSLKIFDNPLLELATRSPWYSVPIVWIPIISIVIYIAVSKGLPVSLVPVVVGIGPFLWNFFEYELHRNIFHMSPSTKWKRIIHFLLHGYHHLYPNDRLRLTFPPLPAAIMAVILYFCCGIFLLPLEYGLAFMCSLFVGYTFYDCIHYYLHHAPPAYSYTNDLKTHHMYHHYRNDQANFGISMTIFDHVFSTFDPVLLQTRKKRRDTEDQKQK